VPTLISLMDDRYIEDAPIKALVWIGKPALPHLLEALTNRANPIHQRGAAAWTIQLMGTNANDTIGVLTGCLRDDPEMAGPVARALSAVATDPSAVFPALIPALTNAMESPSAKVRADAVGAVGFLGRGAIAAVPALRARLTDESETVRITATNVLQEVLESKPGPTDATVPGEPEANVSTSGKDLGF
jgi:HEAT repeat protein